MKDFEKELLRPVQIHDLDRLGIKSYQKTDNGDKFRLLNIS